MINYEYSDKIYIRDLLLRCIIGLNEEERNNKQDVIINIVLFADLKKASKSDNISDSCNYKTIKKSIIGLVENSSFLLIETMAGNISDLCLADDKIDAVKITVDKPGALRFTKSVAVEIFREREIGK
ncbi:MAG: dihydroneopterin aldolase [Spirochaetes bacterium]|nr:dihydroneopterin aldolase [Spirochaetota bacterium]